MQKNTTDNHTSFHDFLQNIIQQEPNTIKAAVATEAFDYEDCNTFFNDLFQHGCISGMVGSLIYYTDTRAFYDKHYGEIEDLRQAWLEETGQPLHIKGDLKNDMAWFAFEATARQIVDEWAYQQEDS